MSQTITLLSTAAECDALTALFLKDKEDLDFQKLRLERQRRIYEGSSVEISAELQAVDAEIAALTGIVASLPDGELKTDNEKRLRRAEYRRFLLQDRQNNTGAPALVELEVDIARISVQLAEVNAVITAVAARKSALP